MINFKQNQVQFERIGNNIPKPWGQVFILDIYCPVSYKEVSKPLAIPALNITKNYPRKQLKLFKLFNRTTLQEVVK